MIDEGYVKFNCHWTPGDAPRGIDGLVETRNALQAMGLIGVYPESGIGYGNVSQRVGAGGQFVVSGTATGRIATATARQFCIVTGWNLETNSVECIGPVAASSESLTHGMLYAASSRINAVLHVHHPSFWKHLLATRPHTPEDVAYGTPAMATEMAKLLENPQVWIHPVVAMAGHEEGIVAFGGNLVDAMAKLLEMYGKSSGGT